MSKCSRVSLSWHLSLGQCLESSVVASGVRQEWMDKFTSADGWLVPAHDHAQQTLASFMITFHRRMIEGQKTFCCRMMQGEPGVSAVGCSHSAVGDRGRPQLGAKDLAHGIFDSSQLASMASTSQPGMGMGFLSNVMSQDYPTPPEQLACASSTRPQIFMNPTWTKITGLVSHVVNRLVLVS